MSAERVNELWSSYLEGELDAAGMQELQTLLESQPGQTARAADLYEIHRLLGMVHQPQSAETFARATRERLQSDREAFVGSLKERLRSVTPEKRRSWRGLPFVAGAAALIAAVLLIQILKLPANPLGDGAKTSVATPARPVATLVRVERARWEPDVTLVEGQRLEPGALRLGNGRAVLLFDNGAVVAAKGPTDLDLESRGSVRLLQGRITVRAEGDAAGFTVRTPAGDARDLGTEFSVAVAINGASEVHVRQGEVAWLPKADAPPSRILHAGEASRFDSVKEEQGHPIVFAMQSLDDFLSQLSSSIPPAKASAYEGFAYGAGESKPEAAGGGQGWAGPWRLRCGDEVTREADTNSAMMFVPQSLQEPSPVDVHGGALEFQPGYSIRVRKLEEAIDLGRDAVYYLSFRLRRESGAAEGIRDPVHFRLTLRKDGDFWGPSLGIGLPASGHPTLQLHSRDTYASPIEIGPEMTTLWVLKIVARRAEPDEAFLKVFKPGEELSAFEPAPWSVVTDRFNFSGVVDLVVLTGSGPGKYLFDELRVGRTWDSVVRKE